MWYSEEHLWVRLDEDGTAHVGVSDHAQTELGNILFIEAPDVGRDIFAGEEVGIIESVKTNTELHAPATGTVIAVNELVVESPAIINTSPVDDGWIFSMELDDESALDDLMDEDAYREFIDED